MALLLVIGLEQANCKLVEIQFHQLPLLVVIRHYQVHHVGGVLAVDIFFVELQSISSHFPGKVIVLEVYPGVIKGIGSVVVVLAVLEGGVTILCDTEESRSVEEYLCRQNTAIDKLGSVAEVATLNHIMLYQGMNELRKKALTRATIFFTVPELYEVQDHIRMEADVDSIHQPPRD